MINKKQFDVIIVGAGLFGCMTAKLLRANNFDVLLIDSEDQYSASKCAIGIYKEGWVNGFKEVYQQSKEVLISFDLIEELEFANMNVVLDEASKKEMFEQLLHIKCDDILNEKRMKAEVINVFNDEVTYDVECGVRIKSIAKICVVVAAGYKNPELLKEYQAQTIENYWGAILKVNKKIDCNRIFQWAPYRQAVLLKTSEDTFLFGDGTKVKNHESRTDMVEKVSARMVQHLQKITQSSDISKITGSKEGIRPILPKSEKGNFFKVVDRKLISITGGGKSSSMVCGYVAKKVFEFVKLKK